MTVVIWNTALQYAIRQMVFLNWVHPKASRKSPRLHFFSIRKFIPQAIIIQQQRHITPTSHAPFIDTLDNDVRHHGALPLGLTVAGGSLHRNRTAGFRQRKFTMEQWGNSSFKVRLGSGAFSQ